MTDIEIVVSATGDPEGIGGEAHVRSLSDLDTNRLRPIAFKYLA